MRSLAERVTGVLRGLLLAGMGLQLLLGALWLFGNMGALPEFEESFLYLQAAGGEDASGVNFIGTGGESALYALLVRGAAGLERALGVPCQVWLYLAQLGAAFAAGYVFLGGFLRSRRGRLFGSGVLLTVPQILQCHLALLPESFLCSCLLLELALCLEGAGSGRMARPGRMTALAALWLVQALLAPGRWWLGLPVLCFCLWRIWGERGSCGGRRLWGSAGILLAGGILSLAAYGTAQGGQSALTLREECLVSAASRFCWPYVGEDYYRLPETVSRRVDLIQAREAAKYADGIRRELFPALETELSREDAALVCRELALYGLRERTRDNAAHILWDLAGYHASSLVLPVWLAGGGYDSLTALNYGQMKAQTPALTKAYVWYHSRFFALGLVAALGIWLAGRGKRDKGSGKCPAGWIVMCAVMLELLILESLLRGAGLMDYKRTAVTLCLWYVPLLRAALADRRQRGAHTSQGV